MDIKTIKKISEKLRVCLENDCSKRKDQLDKLFAKINCRIGFDVGSVVFIGSAMDQCVINSNHIKAEDIEALKAAYNDNKGCRFKIKEDTFLIACKIPVWTEILSPEQEEDKDSTEFTMCIISMDLKEHEKLDCLFAKTPAYLEEGESWVQMTGPSFSFNNTLIDYVIEEYLRATIKYWSFLAFDDDDSAIRLAGERFVRDMIASVSQGFLLRLLGPSVHTLSGPSLYTDINRISQLKYEKSTANSNIIFADISNFFPKKVVDLYDAEDLDISFVSPVRIEDHKLIRKLLEIAQDNICLVCSMNHAHGFVLESNLDIFIKKYDLKGLIKVKICGVSHWEVFCYSNQQWQPLFSSKAFSYAYINNQERQYQELTDALDAAFGKGGYAHDSVKKVVSNAIEQKHGTMVVISNAAKDEAARLQECCIKIAPVKIDNLAQHLTAIDGAILLGADATCYAIGLILDGEHYDNNGESIDRGARHNSAKRYVAWSKKRNVEKYKCVIVIVSEDGDITIHHTQQEEEKG